MADLTPEQEKLSSARDHAYLAAQSLKEWVDDFVRVLNAGDTPDDHLMKRPAGPLTDISYYFALLRKET